MTKWSSSVETWTNPPTVELYNSPLLGWSSVREEFVYDYWGWWPSHWDVEIKCLL